MGDVSVAPLRPMECRAISARFSPLPMGDASVACLYRRDLAHLEQFQSPSHGGRFCCSNAEYVAVPKISSFSPLPMGDASVARKAASSRFAELQFQSPSHGGRFCCPGPPLYASRPYRGFSPLPMGDASVARFSRRNSKRISSFSPLPMGDASVATPSIPAAPAGTAFQSPSHGGRFCCP